MRMVVFCATCSAPLGDDARFCGRCGTPKPVPTSAYEAKEFLIPLPATSPVAGPVGVGYVELGPFLTRRQLQDLGVARPKYADLVYCPALTSIWRHHSAELRERLAEVEAEGWELDEPFEPACDRYRVLTIQGIRHRFDIAEVRVPGAFGLKSASAIKGFRFRMRRINPDHTQPKPVR